MFENQTEEEEEEVIFERDNRGYWCTLHEGKKKPLVITNLNCKSFKQFKLFSCMLCNGASFAKALISIYRVFGLI